MNSFSEVWDQVKLEINRKKLICDAAYNQWIQPITAVEMTDETAKLMAGSSFRKGIVEKRYLQIIAQCFEELMGFPIKVEILCDQDLRDPLSPKSTNTPAASQQGSNEVEETNNKGDYEYTFSTFIVGSSNKFAHAASVAVANTPAKAYNPLFIYGDSGLGKTHLLYAISSEIKNNNPNFNIVYVKGEVFTNELIDAINSATTAQFHDKYRQADVLLVDDIQFIGGKERTQEEFFHTFNALHESGKQIVLTSDRPPKEIKTLEDRLRTRFEWGLVADVQPPDYETRIAIIKRKAELLKLDIPADVSEYIANRIKNNIRQLEGVVKKMNAYKTLTNTPPSIMVAQNSIRDILNENQPIPVTVERIISEVARTYGVSSDDIRSNKRAAQISTARQVAMYAVREITQMSMASIGEEFGGRDHSTVVYSINKMEETLKSNSHIKDTVDDIIKNIRDN